MSTRNSQGTGNIHRPALAQGNDSHAWKYPIEVYVLKTKLPRPRDKTLGSPEVMKVGGRFCISPSDPLRPNNSSDWLLRDGTRRAHPSSPSVLANCLQFQLVTLGDLTESATRDTCSPVRSKQSPEPTLRHPPVPGVLVGITTHSVRASRRTH